MILAKDHEVLEAAELTVGLLEQDAPVRQQMEKYGFTKANVKEGKELLTQAINAQQKKDSSYDAQYELGQQIKAQLEAVQAQFKDHVKVARVAYRNEPTVLHTLRIERIGQKGWPSVRQASYFYHKLQERGLSLAAYGVSNEDVQRATQETTQLLVLRQGRIRQKGVAENYTQEKREAFRALRKWVRECRDVARIAFKDHPQRLEAFGMLVRSTV